MEKQPKSNEAAPERQASTESPPEVAEEGIAAQEDPEEAAAEAEAMSSQGELSELLRQARAEAEQNWGLVLRSRAEIANLGKRHERELENAHKYALDRFVQELLPVRDSLELGLSAAQDDTADVAKLREGTELTLKLFSDVMQKFNIEEVDPQGEPFNPELHQAMSTQPREDVPPNTVVNVVQKGYLLNGRLVRPAMVMVSRPPGRQ